MSVSNTLTDVSYVGDGYQTDFAITFDFKSATHVKAIRKVIATGVETTLAQGVDFTVVGTDVVMGTAPTPAQVLIIYREAPKVQTTTYLTTGPFLPADHEEAMDKLALLIQELSRDIGRSIKLAIGDSAAIDTTLVSPPVAGSVLTINATLDGLKYLDPSTLVGPAGATGPAGANGTNGADGADGVGFLRVGEEAVSNGVSSHTVVFSTPTADALYIPGFKLINEVDSSPIFLQGYVSARTVNGFTITFNALTDSANYKVAYDAKQAI